MRVRGKIKAAHTSTTTTATTTDNIDNTTTIASITCDVARSRPQVYSIALQQSHHHLRHSSSSGRKRSERGKEGEEKYDKKYYSTTINIHYRPLPPHFRQ